ncbi:hypothetical protein PYCC9005_001860 [Savitreella phatthalungensis]
MSSDMSDIDPDEALQREMDAEYSHHAPPDEAIDMASDTAPTPHDLMMRFPEISQLSNAERAELAYEILRKLPLQDVHRVNKMLTRLLHFDFIPVLPVEVVYQIFSFLDYKDVARAARVSRSWYRLATAPSLWRTLYFKQHWNVNEVRVREFENWARTVDSTLPLSAADGPGRNVPPPFHVGHIWKPANGSGRLSLNWVYLFRQHLTLDSNWARGYCDRTMIEALVPVEPADMPEGLQGEANDRAHGIYCLQFDDDMIVTGSRDCKVRVWSMKDHRCTRVMSGHTGSVLCLQVDVATGIIITGSSDTTIMTWDMAAGRALQCYRGHTEPVLNLRFNNDYVLSASKDRTIRIWSRQEGTREAHTCVRVLRGHHAAVNGVQLDGNIIISAGGDHTIRMWHFSTGECFKVIYGHDRGIACIYYDGTYITTGSSDLMIRVFDAKTGKMVRQYEGHSDLVRTVQKDHRKIVSGSYDSSIKIWNLDSQFPATPRWPRSVDFIRPEAPRVYNRHGSLYDANGLDPREDPAAGIAMRQSAVAHASREACVNLGRHQSRVFKLQFDETRIISCSQDSQIMIWDFSRGIDKTFF